MKLEKGDKDLLRSWGYSENDFPQIEEAMKKAKTTYELQGKGHDPADRITREEAVRLLGRREYLSGISRSAFHYSAARNTPDGKTVFFDSSKLFK